MKHFVYVTASAGRSSIWPRVWLAFAAVAAGAILLSLGLVLALAVVLAAFIAVLPVGVWRFFTASRRAQGPVTIEGEYSIAAQTSEESRDDAPGRPYPGDAEFPAGRAEQSLRSNRNAHQASISI